MPATVYFVCVCVLVIRVVLIHCSLYMLLLAQFSIRVRAWVIWHSFLYERGKGQDLNVFNWNWCSMCRVPIPQGTVRPGPETKTSSLVAAVGLGIPTCGTCWARFELGEDDQRIPETEVDRILTGGGVAAFSHQRCVEPCQVRWTVPGELNRAMWVEPCQVSWTVPEVKSSPLRLDCCLLTVDDVQTLTSMCWQPDCKCSHFRNPNFDRDIGYWC